MKKRLLTVLIILLLTGCKVEYNLTIDDDLTISEEVQMTGTDSFFNTYNKTSRLNVIEMMLTNGNKKLLEENAYSIQTIDGDRPYVLVSKKYDSIEKYINDTIFTKQYFDALEYNKKGNILTISSKGFYPIEPDNTERYAVKECAIAITSKYKVVEHNATSYNKKTNTYYWNINDNTENFQLSFSVDSSKKFISNLGTYITVGIFIIIIALSWVIVGFLNKKRNS